MTELSEKLNKAKQAVKLSQAGKAKVRANLLTYMREHPVRPVRPSILARFSGMFRAFSSFTLKPFPMAALIVVIFLAATAGTAAAAENALPGQLLYTWKTGINERVRLQLIRDEDQKAEFEMTLASRRLGEAETLAAKGQLEASAQAQIRASFEEHSAKAQQRVAQLEANHNQSEADRLKQKLTATIESHQHQLSDVGASASINANANIDSQLNLTDNAILSSQAVANLNTDTKPSPAGNDQEQNNAVKSKRQADIKKAQDLLNQARQKLRAGQKADALQLNQEAITVNRQIGQDQQKSDKENSDRTDRSNDHRVILPKTPAKPEVRLK